MKQVKIEITVIQTDKGNIRIKFNNGGSYLIKNTMDNIGIISALEVELEYTLKE